LIAGSASVGQSWLRLNIGPWYCATGGVNPLLATNGSLGTASSAGANGFD
jgi:hypothetical protein